MEALIAMLAVVLLAVTGFPFSFLIESMVKLLVPVPSVATKAEVAETPFPLNAGYEPVLREDQSPEAFSGGMGVVFRARDVHLDRDVAIKRMRPDLLGDSASQQRFLQEARAQGRLRHDNIVAVHAAREDEHGPWVVLEWVEGQNLQDLYHDESGPRPPVEDTISWVLQIADALIYVHQMDFIHRDVKPGNILLRSADRRPLLTDFGLVADRRLSRILSGVSVSGVSMGTWDFIAPEQDRDASKVTALADQWSLGATLGWLITGMTMRTLRERDLPVHLRDVVFRATERHPQDRFRDLREFRDALKSVVVGPTAPLAQRPALAPGFPPVPRPALSPAADSAFPGSSPGVPDPVTASGIDGQCWRCGRVNVGDRKFCAGCGEATREPCLHGKCQQPIGVWERFCPDCGVDQQREREQRQRHVAESRDLILRQLQQQRYDQVLSALQQLQTQHTTPRLRLLLGPVEGLEVQARQVQQAVQQILQQADEQAGRGDYAEAGRTLQQVPEAFWPAAAATWQEAVAELQELQASLRPLIDSGRLQDLRDTLQRLEELQPGRWAAAEPTAECVEVLVGRARHLHDSHQLEAALTQLESIPPGDRTDSCRRQLIEWQDEVQHLQQHGAELSAAGHYNEALELFRDLSEKRRPQNWSAWRSAAAKVAQLQVQLRQNPLQTGWEELCTWLEELQRLQPGNREAAGHTARWQSAWDEEIGGLHRSGRVEQAWQLLQQVPDAGRTEFMGQVLTAIREWTATVSREAEQLAASGHYAEAVGKTEQLPESLRPAVHQQSLQKAARVAALRDQLTADLEKEHLESALQNLLALQVLQPGQWQQEPRLAATVASLVQRAEQLLQQGQTERAGETLATIARRHYGTVEETRRLLDANAPMLANAEALLAALLDAGLGTAALLDAQELLAHEITVFRDRLRVDVQTSSPGIVFDDARPRAVLQRC